MNSMKNKLLEEIMDHMKAKQGGKLKGLLDQSKMAIPGGKESAMEEGMESPEMEMGEHPKGLEIEKVSIMGKKIPGINMGKHHRIAAPGPKDGELQAMIDKKSNGGVGAEEDPGMKADPEMSDDELKELLSQYGI